jgi:xanthine dehydrogenase YagR molybdenum-binding subunit
MFLFGFQECRTKADTIAATRGRSPEHAMHKNARGIQDQSTLPKAKIVPTWSRGACWIPRATAKARRLLVGNKRKPEPRSMRGGTDLAGWGMATGIWEALQVPIAVRILLTANGHAEVSSATSDIGTGTYTIMAQVAADMLGLPIDNVTIRLGDSTLPQSPVEGGSWIAALAANGIATTSDAIREQLLRLAKQMPNSLLADATADEVALADGKLVSKRDASYAVSIAEAMRHGGVHRIEQERSTTFHDDGSRAHNTRSAVFAEVKMDEQLGVIRVSRVVSAVAAGRILNTKTANSQIMGGVVWGIGMALHEETLIDHKFGRILNANMAEYHVPVNADVHDIGVIFVDEPDDIINPLGIKGLREIGIVGVAAAIANAIYHATGRRVRDLLITLDKLQQ